MRVITSISKNAESVYIIKSIRSRFKNSSKVVEKLGTMTSLMDQYHCDRDGVLAIAKQRAAFLSQQEKEDHVEVILKLSSSTLLKKDFQTTFNGGYLFLQDIFYDLKLDKISDSISNKYKFEYDFTTILSRLVYSRILAPCSKLSTYDYSKSFIEQPSFEPHMMYRSLDVLAKETDFIEAEVYKNSLSVIDRNTSILYYDCTNFFFELQQEDGLKQYGKSKENHPNPLAQMGLFMDGNGLPLAFCIHPGNTNEQKTLKPLEIQIMKDFDLSKFIVCTDAGLASRDNRLFNNKHNRSYIVTQSLKQLKSYLKEWALDPEGWRMKGVRKDINLNEIDDEKNINHIYYKERWINENGLEQRLIVSYSPKYKLYQEGIRNKQIQRAQKMVEANTVTVHRNPNSPSRFIHEINHTAEGEVAQQSTLTLNEECIDYEQRYDGFYGVCTTLEDKIEDIIEVNRKRWEIEETFRIMKSEFKARPVYLSNDERIKAHFTTCFLALLIYRILEKKLEEKYTVHELIATLKKMNFQQVKGEGYIPTYTRTDMTDDLHEIFGFRTDTQIVPENKMKKIIRKTKS